MRVRIFGAEILRVWGPGRQPARALSYGDRDGQEANHDSVIISVRLVLWKKSAASLWSLPLPALRRGVAQDASRRKRSCGFFSSRTPIRHQLLPPLPLDGQGPEIAALQHFAEP